MSDFDFTERDGFVLFWGSYLSQWHPCSFKVDGVKYNCAEQYMMAEKARMFRDDKALKQIMASDSPLVQKKLGRRVKDFNIPKWNNVARDVVYTGNMEKFLQNEDLLIQLLDTGSLTLAEASPTDCVWGIGLNANDPNATHPNKWRGKNWLGLTLMRVREDIRKFK